MDYAMNFHRGFPASSTFVAYARASAAKRAAWLS